MTLALIAVIVFLIVWVCQVGDIKAKKKEHQNKTRTCIAREKEIYLNVTGEIDARINAELPLTSSSMEVYNLLMSYFAEYEVLYGCLDAEARNQQIQEDRMDIANDVINWTVESPLDLIKRDARIRYLGKKISFRPYEIIPSNQKETEKHRQNIVAIYGSVEDKEKFESKYGKIEVPNVTLPRHFSRLFVIYRTLIFEIVKKRLYEENLCLSKDGIHESEWQEQEKKTKEMEQLRAKYPYLFR